MPASKLDQAVLALQNNNVVAIPTETVYGLAAAINSEVGIQKIFSIKQRPFFDPLIVHVSSKQMAEGLTTDWHPLADFLAEHFWPGPLTLVLPKAAHVNPMITSGLSTVALRMPKHSMALSLIERVGMPLAAPSANRFGRTSPTSAEHVRSEFPNEDLIILDGGPCEVGVESTVLLIKRDLNDNHHERYQLSILRAGSVTKSDLEKTISNQEFDFTFVATTEKNESPGQMKHHYMPDIPLVLIRAASLPEADILQRAQQKLAAMPEEVDGVKIHKPTSIKKLVELKLPLSAPLAARLLYAELRKWGESKSADLIYFCQQPFHGQEEWAAVMDRLTKASSLILD